MHVNLREDSNSVFGNDRERAWEFSDGNLPRDYTWEVDLKSHSSVWHVEAIEGGNLRDN